MQNKFSSSSPSSDPTSEWIASFVALLCLGTQGLGDAPRMSEWKGQITWFQVGDREGSEGGSAAGVPCLKCPGPGADLPHHLSEP